MEVKKFIAGKPRFCQMCGIESHSLFQVTQKDKKVGELQFCKDCKVKVS